MSFTSLNISHVDFTRTTLSTVKRLRCKIYCSENLKGKLLFLNILWKIIKHGNSAGFFLSGLQVIYDTTLPSFQRVVRVLVRCANCSIPSYFPLEKEKIYSILTSSFLLFGGDGYSMLKDNHTGSISLGIVFTLYTYFL